MLLPKDNSLLLKAVQNNCFRRSTLRRNSRQKLLKRKASEDKSFPKLPQHLLEQRLPRLTLTKTSADCTLWYKSHWHRTSLSDQLRETYHESDTSPYLSSAALNAKDCPKP
ncbi:hypothetical protein E3N88_41346 [Mikania micrantha]|uniref:Uncharacterized protein n=1 Tax=Mikania micrantha TaxID=192012 RepID=A0A5N6LQA5_9ASTR|nr:hypothetical protein E3N88_41346 [Mikania micrantha]